MKPSLHILIFSLASVSLCWADDIIPDKPLSDAATTTTSVSVRESPPTKQLIGVAPPGKEVAVLPKGTPVQVLALVHVRTFSTNTDWIQISFKNPQTGQEQKGWSFVTSGQMTQFEFVNK